MPATEGLFGLAIAERRVVATGDYAGDMTFAHDPDGQRRDGVRLSVTDDGSAFDLAHVATTPLGVAGMRARAEKLGGRLEIRSRPGDGTTVTTDIPLALPDPAPSAATSA